MQKDRILIVEDEVVTALQVKRNVQSFGYEVIDIVDNGDAAIKRVEADSPDLVLMDIRIKGEMDGIDVAEKIRELYRIPVVFSSAYLDQERIDRAKLTMPFGYVLKPIQERELKVTLEMALYLSKVDAERKKAEQRLKERENQLDLIYNATSNYMCLIEHTPPKEFKFSSINRAYEQGVKQIKENVTAQDILGMPIEEFGRFMNWPASLPLSVIENYHKAIKNGHPIRIIEEIPAQAGNLYLEGTYTPIFNEAGDCTHILYVSQDITRFKQIEEALKAKLEEKEKDLK